MKKIKKYFLIIFLLFFGSEILSAQNHAVRGTIVNSYTSQPVPYAAIFLPDLNRGTTADDQGHFFLNNLPGTELHFNFVCLGYRPVSKTIIFSDSITTITIALTPGNREMEEVLVVGTQSHTEDQSSSSVTALSQRGLRSHGALSISDGISKLPGITQLTTGAGISKPVIRGLYGNRIMSVVMGMRFDNQQWQDEHGLGLQDIGIDRVEVIKGPAALMYGSEAMGGVINIIEEKPADADSVQADASMRLFSNTFGAALDGGVRATKGNHFYRIRIGAESQGDYSDGNNKRVQNSLFDGYVGKATFGFNTKKWVSINNYLFSKSDFGFIMDPNSALIPEPRLSRSLDNPHHTVFINLFTTQNTYFGKSGNIFRIIGGTHINQRLEDEGGGGISLNMRLLTAALHLQYEHPLNEKWTIIHGIQSQYQYNKNLGFRVIVPDAELSEASLYSYIKRLAERSVFEGGLRFDLRHITTFNTIHNVISYSDVPTVNKLYETINGSFGGSYELFHDFRLKANITSGYRTPNLAELQSQGVHEGTYRYEIGNPDMKIEQNFCSEAGFSYESKNFEFTATAYDNYFMNYIYLQPSNEDFFGFKIYRYLQTNATLQGGELTLDWSPEKTEWLDISGAYSMVRAKTAEGNYLPFIPADRIDGSLKFELGDKGKWNDIYLRTGTAYYFPQNHPAQFETPTSDYGLIDLGLGSTLKFRNRNAMTIDLCCNNLLNKVYYDHLSRFKEYGIYNMGRNICLNLKYEW